MTGDLQVDADLVVYIDHSDIREGCVEELKERIRRLVAVIEEREPQLISYGFHLEEGRGRLTVTAVHPDNASLELHLDVGREEFRKLGDMVTLRKIEVFGSIDARVRDLLEQKMKMLGGGDVSVVERFAGFSRATATR